MTDDIVECFERNMRKAELLALFRQVGTGENQVDQLRAGKIGNAVPDENPVIAILGKSANDGSFTHSAAVVALAVARMRPCNRNVVSAKVAAVTVNMVFGDTERLKQRVDEEIDPAACYIEGNVMGLAPFEELGKTVPDSCVIQYIGFDFFLLRGGEKREHFADALLNRFALPDNIANDTFPAWRVEVLHDGDDVIGKRNGAVEIAEQYGRTRKAGDLVAQVVGVAQDVRTPQSPMAIRNSS